MNVPTNANYPSYYSGRDTTPAVIQKVGSFLWLVSTVAFRVFGRIGALCRDSWTILNKILDTLATDTGTTGFKASGSTLNRTALFDTVLSQAGDGLVYGQRVTWATVINVVSDQESASDAAGNQPVLAEQLSRSATMEPERVEAVV